MTERTTILRRSVRAVTGLIIAAVAATAVVLLGTVSLPSISRDAVAVTVDTAQGTTRSLVCAGSFAELGADANRSGVAIPSGTASVARAGAAEPTAELARQETGGTLPTVLQGDAETPLAAAQTQQVKTPTLSGLAASACAEPANEQWLVGGDTSVGTSTTLNIGNPGSVPATVHISVYDENGQVDAARTTGVLVPAGAERIVSLNGYAPDRARLAAQVVSTGAPVTASLGIGQVEDIRPFAVDAVTRQLSGETSLLVPGVTNVSDHEHSHGEGSGDDFFVTARALSTEGLRGTATVRALDDAGRSTDLGQIELAPGAVGELQIEHWPEDANAVRIDADVPIVGGVQGAAIESQRTDYAWFAPAPLIPADTETAAAVVSDGQLILVNPGDEAVTAEVGAPDAENPAETEIPAGAAVAVKAPANAVIRASGPIAAGVRVVDDANIAGYPVLPATERSGALTVYPR